MSSLKEVLLADDPVSYLRLLLMKNPKKAFAKYAEAVDSGEFELRFPRKLSRLN